MSIQPGAKVRAKNATHGLAPARPYGPIETVASVDQYDGTVYTTDGNCYLLTQYLYVSAAPACSVVEGA